jgi:TRAP-type uncharacterized transport system substrate-binding protein
MLQKLIKGITASLLLLLWPILGMADPIVFSSGVTGGGYWSAATRLQAVAAKMELEVQVEESPGSLHNLARLLDGGDPTSLVLAQADALRQYLNEHPGLSDTIEILENIGQECVFILTGGDSAIQTDKDLQQGQNYTLAISSPDSGTAVTYAFMATVVPELADISVLYTDTSAAVNGLNAAAGSEVDAVMLVHRPKEYSPEVDLALRNPDQFRFVRVTDARFKSELPNGEAVYKALKLAVPVPDSEERRMVATICVKGLLVANKEKLSRDQRGKLEELVNVHWMEVYATQR